MKIWKNLWKGLLRNFNALVVLPQEKPMEQNEILYEYLMNKFLYFFQEFADNEADVDYRARLQELVKQALNYFSHDLEEYKSHTDTKNRR